MRWWEVMFSARNLEKWQTYGCLLTAMFSYSVAVWFVHLKLWLPYGNLVNTLNMLKAAIFLPHCIEAWTAREFSNFFFSNFVTKNLQTFNSSPQQQLQVSPVKLNSFPTSTRRKSQQNHARTTYFYAPTSLDQATAIKKIDRRGKFPIANF